MADSSPKPSIQVIPDTVPGYGAHACAAIRLIEPYLHPSIKAEFNVEVRESLALDSGEASILVLQRGIQPGAKLGDVENLFRAARKKGIKLVYDIDDNLLDTHPDAETERDIGRIRPFVRFALREADLVTVSTVALKRRVSKLNSRVIVIENGIDETLLANEPDNVSKPASRLRIGYYGTHSHLRDFMLIAAEVRAALESIPQAGSIELIGISKDRRIREIFRNHLVSEARQVTGTYADFTRMMMEGDTWDIGLAPLVKGPFEDCKSDIKFLEYATYGTPGIYSRVPAYEAIDGTGMGVLCGTGEGEWKDQIVRLAGNLRLRQNIVFESRRHVNDNRTLKRLSEIRTRALLGVLGVHSGSGKVEALSGSVGKARQTA